MFCPKCGKMNPDDGEKCSGCGASLHEERALVPAAKKGGALKIVIAIAIILIVVLIAIFFLSGCAGTQLPEDRMSF